ncbi:hypothetical protein AXF42_Ash001926 [Apostasia shenzhenica]|uniref:Centromere-associated protein E n=1 Tax=Apostasia shenzhenica TaxID=1088818 RepID=A0A2I0ABP3_9ASPA|nr:hypothetical protein AXF42_Ash001926 [Apostasia shenzhenica]
MCELLEQLEASKVQNESLTKRISEMECYYESLIHELEGGQKQTAHQLENLRAEHTSCLCMISALQNENDKLQHDMNAQLMRFSEEQQALKSYVKELEKRAISSETMLKRVRWNYSTAVDRMQKDLQLLSFQVLSMFEANETLAKEALSGASSEHLDELFEHMPHWYRAEWLAPLSQQQRPALSEVQREIAVTCSDQELSPMLNDTSDNVNDQMLNKFASIDEIKEASKTGSPMVSKFNLEIGNAPKDALKLLDTSMVYEIDVMQEKKDPLFSTHFPTEKERYNSLPSIPFAKDQKELKRVCLKSCKIQNMNDFCCCSELLSDNGDTMVETEIFFNKLKQLHASKETEILEAHMVSNHLEVYTRILHETLRDVFYGIGHMNSMITELQQQLDHCTIDKEMLTLKLHDLRDVADTLRKTEARYIKKYDNLESKNHIMEVKLHAALDEKSFLAQNVAECQWLVGEYGAYESMYKASVAEKLELETMLKEEILQRTYIQCKINSMVEDLKSLKESYDIQCSLNSNLQKCTTYLQCRLRDLCNGMISCVQEVSCTRFGHISAPEELNNENCDAIISFLEQLQQETRHLLIKLHQEKKLAEKQRDLFQGILFVKDSDISSLELQSKSHLEELITSLVLSNLNVENLQLELHNVTEQLRHSTEMEEKQRSNNKQLLSKMTNFLNGMIFCNQQVSCSLFDDISVPEKLDYENCDAIIFLLEHFGQHACHKLIKLHQEKKLAEEQREVAQCALDKKESHIFDMKQHFESELEEIRRKLELSNMKVEELQVELQDTVDKLTLTTTTAESHKLTSKGFLSKIANLCDHIVSFYQQVGSSLFDDIFVPQELNGENYDALISCLEQFQQVTCHKLVKLHEEQMLINEQREIAERTLNAKELHMSGMKQQFESELAEIRIKLELSNAKVENLEFKLQDTVDKLKLSIETVEKYKSKNRELSSKMAILEIELQQTADECRDFYQKLLVADSVNEELARTKSSLTESLQENKNLLSSIQLGNETSVKMKIELSSLRENLHFLREQLHSERKVRGKLDIVVADLTSKLEATNKQISYLDEQNAELCHLRTRVLDLEREMQHYLVYYEETCEKTNAETSSLHLQVADLDNHLASAIMHFIFSDVEVTYMRNQLYFMEEGILEHQKKSEDTLEELYLMHLDDVTSTKNFIANKAAFVAEIGRFSTDLQSTRSRLELIIGEKQSLVHHINDSLMELANFEDLNAKEASFEADCFEPPNYQYEVESCILRNMLLSFVAELDELWLSKVELDIVVVFLRSKVDACECELRKLRSQHNELNQKLLEQTLKTEQFKNLSIHLRELKDKADAEYHQTIERRESESSSIVGQESLRIAFIKEQYESKLQELRNQCSVSQKYAEEMLMKLQNALDEIEYRKKNEASLAKRNEDMAIELSDLDIELQTTTTDRKVLIKSYESMKADLECTVLCLKCCEEEKLKLENSLKDSSVEREKIRIELDLVKRLLENMATSTGPGIRHHVADRKATLIGELLGNGCSGTSVVFQETPITGRGSCIVDDQVTKCGADHVNGTGELYSCRELEDVDPTSVTGGSCLSVQLEQAKNIVEDIAPDRVMFLENNAKQLADMKEHFMEQQRLMASMELFHNQLERFKNDNLPSDFQLDERYLTADLQDLKTELQQLDMLFHAGK